MDRRGAVWTWGAWVLVAGLASGCASGPGRALPTRGGREAARAPEGREALPRAALTDTLAERVELVETAFRERGAHPVAERWVTFLREGRARVMSVTVERAQCLGFAGVARATLGDLDLYLYNEAGIQLTRDERDDAHPFVRVCVPAGARLHVAARAARGNGEVAVITLADPPVVPPPLDGVLGVRPTGAFAGPRAPRVAVGADPAVTTAGEALRLSVARLAEQGYRGGMPPRTGSLGQQQTAQEEVGLVGGACYAVVAAGGVGVDDLDLRVRGPDGNPIAQDVAVDAHPVVRFCATQSGRHGVDVRMYSGAGDWALTVLESDAPDVLPGDVTGVGRARAQELVAEASRRGLGLVGRPVRGAFWSVGTMTFPLRMRAGRCYLVGAAASERMVNVEVSLADPAGAVLGSDTGERERARVYHCATRDQRVTATVRSDASRGEFVFLAFESRG